MGSKGSGGAQGGWSHRGPRPAGRGAGRCVPRGSGGGPQGDRAERGRNKKLLVAFHFQFANQAGWKCDDCRRSGLEKRRRCGWLGIPEDASLPPVWVPKTAALGTCPTSYITAESESLIEEFFVRKRLGAWGFDGLSARQ